MCVCVYIVSRPRQPVDIYRLASLPSFNAQSLLVANPVHFISINGRLINHALHRSEDHVVGRLPLFDCSVAACLLFF